MNYTVKAVLQTLIRVDVPELSSVAGTSPGVNWDTSTTESTFLNVTDNLPAGPSYNWPVLLLLPWISLWGFIGNAMVCIAIYTDRRLQNITNYFLFSLAIADLLVSALVMPLAIDVELNFGDWRHSTLVCGVYIYSDVFLCSASIVHMSVISLDRYLGISRPFKTRNKSQKVVMLKITLVWVVTVLISSPIAALAYQDSRNVMTDAGGCEITNRYYMIYGSTLAFLIPFLIMLVTYCKTTQLLNLQAAQLSARHADGTKRMDGLRRTVNTPRNRASYRGGRGEMTSTTSFVQPSTGSKLTLSHPSAKYSAISDSGLIRQHQQQQLQLQQQPSNASGARRPSQIAEKSETRQTDEESDTERALRVKRTSRPMIDTDSVSNTSLKQNGTSSRPSLGSICSRASRPGSMTPHMLRLQRFKRQTQLVFWQLAHKAGAPNALTAASQELANEHKATRVLAVVFCCFFFCWTPFFLLNFTSAFCGDACPVPPLLASIFLWLGYTSSTVNPVIYTVFNRRFREAFCRILHCGCCGWCRHGGQPRGAAGGQYAITTSTFHPLNSNGGVAIGGPHHDSVRHYARYAPVSVTDRRKMTGAMPSSTAESASPPPKLTPAQQRVIYAKPKKLSLSASSTELAPLQNSSSNEQCSPRPSAASSWKATRHHTVLGLSTSSTQEDVRHHGFESLQGIAELGSSGETLAAISLKRRIDTGDAGGLVSPLLSRCKADARSESVVLTNNNTVETAGGLLSPIQGDEMVNIDGVRETFV